MRGILRRLTGHVARGLLMIWVVTTFSFFIVSVMPGDPIQARYEELITVEGVSPESARAQVELLARFRPDGSLWEQYVDYMGSLFRFDLGQSLSNQVDVSSMLLTDIKWTMLPLLIGTILSFTAGVFMGVVAAVKRSGRLGSFLATSGSLVNALPPYMTALFFGSTLVTLWPILPRGSTVDIAIDPGFNAEYIGSLAYHAALPMLAYGFTAYGGWILAMRSSVVTVLGDDFILAAELRGMTKRTVYRYITRNAILPLFTVFAISIGTLFSGAIYIEQIFNYSGLGQRMLGAIAARDISVITGALLVITVAVIAANIIADVVYSLIDPRIRRGGEAA